MGDCKVVEKLPDLHAIVHAEVIGHVADDTAYAQWVSRYAVAGDNSLPIRRPQQRCEESNSRTLACPVWANETKYVATLDLQIETIDSKKVAVSFAKVDDFNHDSSKMHNYHRETNRPILSRVDLLARYC